MVKIKIAFSPDTAKPLIFKPVNKSFDCDGIQFSPTGLSEVPTE